MESEVAIELLNGMPLVVFKKWFILAMTGAFLYLIIRIIIILGPTGSNPPRFSWKYFFRGFLKLLVTLIFAPWVILYFEDVMPLIMEFLFNMGTSTGDESASVTIELNGASAFGLGFSIDFLTYKAIKKMRKLKPPSR